MALESVSYTPSVQIRGASALVTGAGRGIGRAIARALGAQGAHLTLVSRTRADLDSLLGEIQAAGGRAVAHPGDIREGAVCAGAVARAVEAHGGLQILVNNAAVATHRPLAETSDDDWQRVIDTNLTAVFRLTRASLPHLAARGGHVFMISSLAGSNPVAGMAPYCASKAALDHLAACLMLEVRHHGIKVTTLAPGSVSTSFGGRREGAPGDGWMLRPEDIADTLVDLLKMRDDAHLSRAEMRPLRPQKRS